MDKKTTTKTEQSSSSEKLNLIATLLTAVATTGAAMAAYYSVEAADRQETATYESALASKQIDLLGAFNAQYRADYNDAISLHNDVDDYIRRGKSVPKINNHITASMSRTDAFQQAIGPMPLALPIAATDRAASAALLIGAALYIDKARLESWDNEHKAQAEKVEFDTEQAPDFGRKLSAAQSEIGMIKKCSEPLHLGRALKQADFLRCIQGQ